MQGKYIFLISSGLITFFLPFLGVPQSWKDILLMIIGIGVSVTAFSLYKKQDISAFFAPVRSSDTFVESTPVAVDDTESLPQEEIVPAAENFDRSNIVSSAEDIR